MRRWLALLIVILSVPTLGNDDALFEEVFGKKIPEKSYEIKLKLVIEREHYTSIVGKINPYTQSIKLKKDTLWSIISPYVLDSAQDTLLSGSTTPEISLAQLKAIGYTASYDAIYQTLHIGLPFDAKKAHTLSLNSKFFDNTLDFSQPISNWSGYTNIHIDVERTSAFYSFDSIWSVRDWFSIEHVSSLDSDNPNVLSFSEVRLVHEQPNKLTETFIGDIQTRQQLQTISTPKMLGISHRKSFEEFSVNPPQPIVEHAITVSSNSKIIVRNNAITQGIFNVKPGTYTITEIPVSNGKNTIEIQTISDTHESTHTFTHYHDRNILRKGSSEYSLSLGLPHELSPQWRVTEHEAVGGIGLRTGLTQTLTSEISLSKASDAWTLSNSFLTASEPGLIEVKTETTQYDLQANDYTLGLLIQGYSNQKSEVLKTRQDIQVIAQNNQKYTFNNTPVTDTALHADIAKILDYPTYSLSLKPGYTYYKNTDRNTLSFTFSISKIIRTLQSQFSLVYAQNPDLESSIKWIVRLTRAKSSSRTDINSTFIEDTNQVRVNWAYYPDPNSISSQINYSQDGDNDASLSTQLRYKDLKGRYTKDVSNSANDAGRFSSEFNGKRFNLGLAQRYDGDDIYTAGTFHTAIAFADNAVGITKEVNNGFTIFTAPKSLEYTFIQFNTEDKITKRSPAVVTKLIPYQPHTVSIAKSKLPENTFLQEHNFQIKPRKRQGSVTSIAPFGNVMLIGYLNHENGTPLEYEFGEISHSNDTSFTKQFFTNKSGKFVVTGLSPGDYTLTFYNTSLRQTKINVPEKSKSIVKLEAIRVLTQ